MPSSILSVIWMTMFRVYSTVSRWKICNSLRTASRAVMTWFLRLVNLEYKRFYKAEGVFESLSRTVTCTRGFISIYMCYSQRDGINTPLSRLLYLVLYTVVQLSGCPLVPCLCTVSSTLCVGRSCEWYINYVYLYISSPYVNPNINSTPVPEC